jgi:thiol-disulfide isomerase/thioredoxin
VTPKKSSIIFSLVLVISASVLAQTELVGPLTPEEILQRIPEWRKYYEAYSPDLNIVGGLQRIHEQIRVEVFLGTWCPDCRQHVNAYFKIMDMVRNPLIQTSYTGVPRDRQARGPYIEGKDIQRIPTFIVYFRDREIGRLIETPKLSVEADLWQILGPKLGDR